MCGPLIAGQSNGTMGVDVRTTSTYFVMGQAPGAWSRCALETGLSNRRDPIAA